MIEAKVIAHSVAHVARPLDLRDMPGVNRNFKEWTQFRAELGL